MRGAGRLTQRRRDLGGGVSGQPPRRRYPDGRRLRLGLQPCQQGQRSASGGTGAGGSHGSQGLGGQLRRVTAVCALSLQHLQSGGPGRSPTAAVRGEGAHQPIEQRQSRVGAGPGQRPDQQRHVRRAGQPPQGAPHACLVTGQSRQRGQQARYGAGEDASLHRLHRLHRRRRHREDPVGEGALDLDGGVAHADQPRQLQGSQPQVSIGIGQGGAQRRLRTGIGQAQEAVPGSPAQLRLPVERGLDDRRHSVAISQRHQRLERGQGCRPTHLQQGAQGRCRSRNAQQAGQPRGHGGALILRRQRLLEPGCHRARMAGQRLFQVALQRPPVQLHQQAAEGLRRADLPEGAHRLTTLAIGGAAPGQRRQRGDRCREAEHAESIDDSGPQLLCAVIQLGQQGQPRPAVAQAAQGADGLALDLGIHVAQSFDERHHRSPIAGPPQQPRRREAHGGTRIVEQEGDSRGGRTGLPLQQRQRRQLHRAVGVPEGAFHRRTRAGGQPRGQSQSFERGGPLRGTGAPQPFGDGLDTGAILAGGQDTRRAEPDRAIGISQRGAQE
jgi:hypothetical protein